MAQPFDASGWRSRGMPVPVAERVGSFRDGGFFSASANDVLVYRTADTDSQLTWFDRQGTVSGRASEPGGFRGVALSPDGARAVASRTESAGHDQGRPVAVRSVARKRGHTIDARHRTSPSFLSGLADGKRIVFTFNNS